jgi:hypothetical protein
MSVMIRYLKELKLSQEFADIYRDELDAETLRGRVADIAEELIQIERYSDEGEYEGISFIITADITRARSKGRELDLVKSASQHSSRKPSLAALKSRTLWDAVDEIQRVQGYVCLHVENIDPDMCVIGEVIEQDGGFVRLIEYGTLKTQDRREIVVDKEAVTRVDYDGRYESIVASAANT